VFFPKTFILQLEKRYPMLASSLKAPLLFAFSRVYFAVKRKSHSFHGALVILASLLGKKSAHIVLADDDPEDREIFLEVINEVVPHVQVTVAKKRKRINDYAFAKGGYTRYPIPRPEHAP